MFKKKEPKDPTWRYKVLEELLEKCDTPEQIKLLMETNVDRTAGLLHEIYVLEGRIAGYEKIIDGFVNRFWDKYDEYIDRTE